MSDWYAPNAQAVGVEIASETATPPPDGGGETPVDPLDSMTKDELVAYADANGIEVSASWTKADIRATIDAAG